MKPGLSVVIPTLNESDNIKLLVERIDAALRRNDVLYELVFIDDHSTDDTQNTINSLADVYPISLYEKKGRQGKAFSIIQGISLAKFEIVAMIDADLQYPPEALPSMYRKVFKNKADVVVANRSSQKTSVVRRVLSGGFRKVFGKFLHGLECDVQSGLKVFKKEITERIRLTPSSWTFDLEFLVKARQSGYRIASKNIDFAKRNAGQAKVGVGSIFEIGLSAVKVKLMRNEFIPFSAAMLSKDGFGFHYKGKKYVTHSTLHHGQTAFRRLSFAQKIGGFAVLIAMLGFLATNWFDMVVVIVSVLSVVYFVDLLFSIYLAYRSFTTKPEVKVSKTDLKRYSKSWPKYTVFCPLYKEAQVLPQFVRAMSKLDYPKSKLEVMLLLESDDKDTIRVAKKMGLPSFVEIVVVPDSFPKTKPKACNYGLSKATGEYSVIYDAEDVPDPDQLKKAVVAFERLGEKVGCIQAKLNYYNPRQNLLTQLFTLEYSLWFGLILPGLQSINAPIPLGGTSNHFRTRELRLLEGWDAFNVTEDADLGLRIYKCGFLTAVLDSHTMEEANSQMKNWLKQRSRWIKGYYLTYLVHMRRPHLFVKGWKDLHFFTFQLVVGFKMFSMVINPLLWVMTGMYFLSRESAGEFIASLYQPAPYYIASFSLVFGNFFYFYSYLMGLAKRRLWALAPVTFLVPVYWLLMSVASVYAFYELLVRPHHWNKTLHGLHLGPKKKKAFASENDEGLVVKPLPEKLRFGFIYNRISSLL